MTANSLLETPPPSVSVGEAARCARERFGLEAADARPLPGERDRNFLIVTGSDDRFVMRFVHPAEDPAISDMQAGLLSHLAARGVPAQRLVTPLPGSAPCVRLEQEPFVECLVRCSTFLPGERLSDMAPAPARWRSLGRFLARLDAALEDFSHRMAGRPFLWDLRCAEELRPLVRHVTDADTRGRVVAILDAFADDVLPRFPGLRSQVIQNDANPQNVLVDAAAPDRIAGVIDFGDAVHAPLVQELGVAIAYQPLDGTEPFRAALELTRGYHQTRPLEDAELRIIPALAATRLALITIITSWRSALHPENASYIMRNEATISANLALMPMLCTDSGAARFAAAVEGDQPLTGGIT